MATGKEDIAGFTLVRWGPGKTDTWSKSRWSEGDPQFEVKVIRKLLEKIREYGGKNPSVKLTTYVADAGVVVATAMSESAAKSIRTKLGQIAETNAGVGNAALHVKIIGDFKVSYTVRDESDFNALPYLLAATPAVFDQTGNYRMGENIARLIMDDHAVLLNQGASDMKVTYKIDI